MLFKIEMFIIPTLIFLFNFHYNFALKCEVNGSTFCSSDCNQILKCIAGKSYILMECIRGGSRCNSINKSCIVLSKPATPGTCIQVNDLDETQCGPTKKAIPHITDCTKYIQCNETKKLVMCPNGRSFNPLTRICDQDLNSYVCRNGLTPICNESNFGEFGPIDENPQFYWLCVYKQPFYTMEIFECPDGTIFKKEFANCISEQATVTTELPTLMTEPQNPSTTTSKPNNYQCTGYEYYADEADCHCFYSCSGYHRPSERLCCPENQIFNPKENVCTIGICNTELTTLMTEPQNPSTTTSKPNNYQCTGYEYYADEADCHCFYSCSGYHRPSERLCCPENQIFNPKENVCTIGICNTEKQN